MKIAAEFVDGILYFEKSDVEKFIENFLNFTNDAEIEYDEVVYTELFLKEIEKEFEDESFVCDCFYNQAKEILFEKFAEIEKDLQL